MVYIHMSHDYMCILCGKIILCGVLAIDILFILIKDAGNLLLYIIETNSKIIIISI